MQHRARPRRKGTAPRAEGLRVQEAGAGARYGICPPAAHDAAARTVRDLCSSLLSAESPTGRKIRKAEDRKCGISKTIASRGYPSTFGPSEHPRINDNAEVSAAQIDSRSLNSSMGYCGTCLEAVYSSRVAAGQVKI